jgi:hypothetical protein
VPAQRLGAAERQHHDARVRVRVRKHQRLRRPSPQVLCPIPSKTS